MHEMSMQGPSMQMPVQLPPLQTGQLAASNDPAMHALLDRLHQLESYKTHLEHENKQMHHQLQVLSGFLNIVSNAVRTTENMLFSGVPPNDAPHVGMTNAEGSHMGVSAASTATAGPVPNSTPTPTGAMQHAGILGAGSNAIPTGSGNYAGPAGSSAAAAAAHQQQQQAQQQQQLQLQQQQQTAQHQQAQQQQPPASNGQHPAAAATTAVGAAQAPTATNANGSSAAAAVSTGNCYRRRSSATDLTALDGSRKRPRTEQQQQQQHQQPQPPPQQQPSPALPPPPAAAAASGPNSAALAAAAAAAAAAAGYLQQQQPPQQQQAPLPTAGPNPAALAAAAAAAAAAGYMQQQQQPQGPPPHAYMQQLMPMGIPMIGSGTSDVSLRLTKVRGKTVLQGDDVMIYRVELARCGVFEKYLFLPNDAIPIYGVRAWQHRDAIPQELLKMVENCLTTKAVASEQYIEEIKAMKAYMLQQCPHLARWGLGSNKVRLVTESGMRDLVSRLHRTMQKHGTVILPKTLEVDVNWISAADAPQIPVHMWCAPVYSRRLQNLAEDTYAAAAAAAAAMPYGLPSLPHAGSSSGMLCPDSSPSQSGIAVSGGMVNHQDMYQQQQLLPCGVPNMLPVMIPNGQQQQYEQQQYYSQQVDMAAMQQHQSMLQQQHASMQQQDAMHHHHHHHQQQQQHPNGAAVHDGYGPPGGLPASAVALQGMQAQGSRSDLPAGLISNGPAAGAAAAEDDAAANGLHGHGSSALDAAAVAAMVSAHLQQQQQQQQPAVTAGDMAHHHQQQPVSPKAGLQQQQQHQRSPGAAGSNGSTDSTMAEAAAGLAALSNQEQQQQLQGKQAASVTVDAPHQQQQDVPVKDGKGRDQQMQQQQAGPDNVSGHRQLGPGHAPVDRQTSVPSPDATAAMCSAAATAIAVQQ